MAGRMASLIDPDTNKAIDGAIVKVDLSYCSIEPSKFRYNYCAWHDRLPSTYSSQKF